MVVESTLNTVRAGGGKGQRRVGGCNGVHDHTALINGAAAVHLYTNAVSIGVRVPVGLVRDCYRPNFG